VRLCFGSIDQIIMDLDGCYTMADLVEKISLHLMEELGSDKIAYVDVKREDLKNFRMGSRDMNQCRLLPGLGRERAYVLFLGLLMRAPSQAENRRFRFFVVTEKSPESRKEIMLSD
jgi:hypothetical protein